MFKKLFLISLLLSLYVSRLVAMEASPVKVSDNKRHLTQVSHFVSHKSREEKNRHRGGVLWLTGLSASGKSTLAMELEKQLFEKGFRVNVLDGDNTRSHINSDLGFSPADREENLRRVAEIARLFADNGSICITAFISPYESSRTRAREIVKGNFHVVYVKSDLETCERRDPKGLYKKARGGEIKEFTGISSPYEEPSAPQLTIDTSELNIEQSVDCLVSYIKEHFL